MVNGRFGGRGVRAELFCSAVVALLLTGCGPSPTAIEASARTAAPTSSAPGAAAQPTAQPTGTPSSASPSSSGSTIGSPPPAADAAPSGAPNGGHTRAARPGQRSTSARAVLTKQIAGGSASHADGVQITLGDLTRGTVSGEGPGIIKGQRYTRVTVTVTNNGTTPVDASRTIVTLRHGPDRLLAAPVYDEQTRDLSAVLAPGQRAQAAYAFAVPDDDLGSATIAVDLDAKHPLAVFEGPLR